MADPIDDHHRLAPNGAVDVVLISTYELGRQPFGLASPAAWLRDTGAVVELQDLAVHALDLRSIESARMVGFYVPMHTATRLAEPVLEKVRSVNPDARIAFFGLYAPLNAARLRSLGAEVILGGEFEEGLVEFWKSIVAGAESPALPAISLARQRFRAPDRAGLPGLDRYARLQVDPATTRVTGYTEASRGCKHLCRHCPIVPVYDGTFRIVPADVVLADIGAQVAAGAQHVTFGDPDFFNGPAHATRLIRRLHDEFPALTYDVTIKVEHLLGNADLLPVLVETGCILVTSAIESFDDTVLSSLAKGHTGADVAAAIDRLRSVGLALNPTFLPFTPWTTAAGYAAFLSNVAELDLIGAISPIQYAIRLLIPAGSRLLELPDVAALVGEFDENQLAYPWRHPDPALDELHGQILAAVEVGEKAGSGRHEMFEKIWELAQSAAGTNEAPPPMREARDIATVPYLTEPWYC